MRTKPVGTGRSSSLIQGHESIKLVRTRTTGERACRTSTASRFTIIPNRSTAILPSSPASRHDVSDRGIVPLLQGRQDASPERGVRGRADQRQHQYHRQLVSPPFDHLDIPRAMALALDRPAFISILNEGQADIGAHASAPGGLWAMPKEMMETIPGYALKSRPTARRRVTDAEAGYGPDKHLPVKGLDPAISRYRDPAVILIDQLTSRSISDGETRCRRNANWF